MNSHRAKNRPSRRDAFTLMEMLLVLAVLVLIAAIVVPSFKYTLQDQRLRSAADTVRTEWNKAHIKAMKTGRIHVFRYEPGGRKFEIEPYSADDDTADGVGGSKSQFGQPAAAPQTAPTSGQGKDGPQDSRYQLPEGIKFLEGQRSEDTRSQAVESGFGGGNTGGSSGGQWSKPILFYPDGVSSDAWLAVADEHDGAIRVELRGLTGLAVVGDRTTTGEAQK